MGNNISLEEMKELENTFLKKKYIKSYVHLYNRTVTLYNLLFTMIVMVCVYLLYYLIKKVYNSNFYI